MNRTQADRAVYVDLRFNEQNGSLLLATFRHHHEEAILSSTVLAMFLV